MSMAYYRRRHREDKGGNNKVTTLSNLSQSEEVKTEEKPKKAKKAE